MDILTIDHLTKVYGSGPTALKALDDVSFSVAAGEFVAIVGSSGSGKSTLLHLMGGVDRPTSGTVLLNGADAVSYTHLRRTDVSCETSVRVFHSTNDVRWNPSLEAAQSRASPCSRLDV